jgi:hypothetical protein
MTFDDARAKRRHSARGARGETARDDATRGEAHRANARVMADAPTPAPAAGGGGGNALSNAVVTVVRSFLLFYALSSFFGPKHRGGTTTGAGSPDAAAAAIPRTRPMYAKGEPLEMWAYVTEDATFAHDRDDDDARRRLVAREERLPLCGDAPTLPTDGADDGAREYRIAHVITEDALARNATPWLHVFFARPGSPIDPSDARYDARDVFGGSMPLVRYYPKRSRQSERKNLLTGTMASSSSSSSSSSRGGAGSDSDGDGSDARGGGGGDDDDSDDSDSDSDGGGWTPHFKPNVTVSIVDEFAAFPLTGMGLPQQMREHMRFESGNASSADHPGDYYPVVFMNEFWLLRDYLVPINETVPAVNLTLSIAPLSPWKWQLMLQMEKNFEAQRAMGAAGEKDSDELKRVLLEGNPILLAVTGCVSFLHMIFDALAFKNDVTFWRANKSMEGLSARTIVFNACCQCVVFLYLLDNDTSWMILLSSGVGLLIEFWKITKAMDVSFDANAFPYVTVKDKHGYRASDTAKHDEVAMRYLSYALYPLVGCYAVYAVLYNEHKGWYSFVLNVLVGAVYLFGFITMTPQLYINYKLKSVAHLPWRQMTYKFLNTIIDDLFAFVIKMPLMHRLSVFRDDVIFLAMLYQRWIYKVDKTRVNEFGFTGEDGAAAAGLAAGAGGEEENSGDADVASETKKDK